MADRPETNTVFTRTETSAPAKRWRISRFSYRLWLAAMLMAAVSSAFATDQWVEVRSQHFSVITDAGAAQGREAAKRFEQTRTAFQLIFVGMKADNPVPLQIFAFRNDKRMKQVAPIWKGKPVELAGLFQRGEDRSFIALDLSSPSGWEVAIHEYMHLLIDANLPPTPAWFDEGFAEYFSTLRFEGKRIYFGSIKPGHVETLRTSRFMRCTDLFSVGHDSPEYNEGNRRTIFYAQSWLVVQFLLNQNRLPQIVKYLELTQQQHQPIAAAIQEAFGVSPATFDQQLLDFFHGRSAEFYLAVPKEVEAGSYQVIALDDNTATARLDDMKAHTRDHRDEALADFRNILEKDPANVLANRDLGYAAMRAHDFDAAAGYFQQAIKADTDDARVYYFMAMVQAHGAPILGESEEIAYLKKAIDLDPGYADAYSMLGVSLAFSGQKDLGKTYARRAVELSPRNEHFAMNLASVFVRLGEWNEAQTILTELLKSRDQQIAAIASQNLASLKNMREHAERRWDGAGRAPSSGAGAVHNSEIVAPDTILHLQGVVESVQCIGNLAMLRFKVGEDEWVLRVKDVSRVTLIGTDALSCDWKMLKVAVNCRTFAPNSADVVSLELK